MSSVIEFRNVCKYFGSVIALENVSFAVPSGGTVCCLLGDNGAGKSTLIKTLAGVHKPSKGEILIEGQPVEFSSPREALDRGIATVYQDLALVSLMSITRNFFMGREPTRKLLGAVPIFDVEEAGKTAVRALQELGIDVRNPDQAVGTMSGGERQSLAIARAVYFGAKVLILDEPTAALGVKQTGNVLRMIHRVKERGVSVILITHNIHHAYPVADMFTLLNRGQSMGTFTKKEIAKEKVLEMMSGGRELDQLTEEFAHQDKPSSP